MNKCLNCGKPVNNKYCNVSCQNKHLNSKRADKRYGEYKIFIVECESCGKKFEVKEREKKHPIKDKYYCSRSCANKRTHTEVTKKKISESLKTSKLISWHDNVKKICKECGKEFEVEYRRRNQVYCSKSCATIWRNKHENIGHKGGVASAKKRVKRSKNEIYFAELCKNEFNEVLTNEPIFNGWDADVIIEDLKIAVLWNGKWHYEKITHKHSVKQVQNRDAIKIKEIKASGYTPYIIKDMGRYNKTFVEKEFIKFINKIKNKNE